MWTVLGVMLLHCSPTYLGSSTLGKAGFLLWPHLDARRQGAGLRHARVGMEYPHALLFPTRSSTKFKDSKLSKCGQTFADNQRRPHPRHWVPNFKFSNSSSPVSFIPW